MIVPRCFLSRRAVPVRSTHHRVARSLVGILKQLMAAQKEEEERNANHAGLVAAKEEFATLTATIETKLTRQGDLAVEVESLKNDLAYTQRSLAADLELAAKLAESRSSQSSEWNERQESSHGEGAPCEYHTSRKTHARSTLECGWLLASATSSDRLSCDSHGALCTSLHTLWCCVHLVAWPVTSREQIVVEQIVADPVPQILDGVQHVPQERVQNPVVDVPVPQIREEIVELVAGQVVCNARTGVRRQHGWTCTN